MSSINRRAPQVPAPRTHEGAIAARIKPIQELRRTVLACMLWEDQFYESGQSIADRIKNLVKICVEQGDADRVDNLAREARDTFKLRHVPLLVARELVRNGYNITELLSYIIQRPDELTEFCAIYSQDRTGTKQLNKFPASAKRGLARAFQKFNAYSLAKYNRDNAIKLRDVLFLSHAKPRSCPACFGDKRIGEVICTVCQGSGKDEQQIDTWKQLINGTLPIPDMWETQLSAGANKKETFERLMHEQKLGALALLRNLRGMKEAGVNDATIRQALFLCNPERVLPFRFITAARYAPQFEPELEQLMFKCLTDRPKLSGRTVLLVDGSGSMFGTKVSAKSELDRFDAAAALAMLVRETCEQVAVIVFSTDAFLVPARRGFALRDIIKQAAQQHSTNTETAKQHADKLGYDRIIIITDEQSHQTITKPLPGTKGYVLNVASYQNGIGYGPWVNITGWSEAVLDFIQAHEAEEEVVNA